MMTRKIFCRLFYYWSWYCSFALSKGEERIWYFRCTYDIYEILDPLGSEFVWTNLRSKRDLKLHLYIAVPLYHSWSAVGINMMKSINLCNVAWIAYLTEWIVSNKFDPLNSQKYQVRLSTKEVWLLPSFSSMFLLCFTWSLWPGHIT